MPRNPWELSEKDAIKAEEFIKDIPSFKNLLECIDFWILIKRYATAKLSEFTTAREFCQHNWIWEFEPEVSRECSICGQKDYYRKEV